jgi:hypothetical protein
VQITEAFPGGDFEHTRGARGAWKRRRCKWTKSEA